MINILIGTLIIFYIILEVFKKKPFESIKRGEPIYRKPVCVLKTVLLIMVYILLMYNRFIKREVFTLTGKWYLALFLYVLLAFVIVLSIRECKISILTEKGEIESEESKNIEDTDD